MSLQPAMRRMATGILHDEEQAADIVQETLTHLWQHRWRLGRMKNPQGYAMNALHNQCVDTLRRDRHNTSLDSLQQEPAADDGNAEQEQRYQQLQQSIAQLPPRHQELIRLRYVEQLSSREIAQRTGMSETNVNTLFSRIYAELRKRLAE